MANLWEEAEQELIAQPRTEVKEWGHGIAIRISCLGVDPRHLRIFMTSSELLAMGPMNTAGSERWILRHLHFPHRIDADDASAGLENGT